MRKKIISFVLACFVCIFFYNVEAETCSKDVSRDLTKEAYYVKTTYEVVDKSIYKEIVVGEDKTTFKIPKYEFNISIYNITKNLYVVVENDVNDTVLTIRHTDTQEGVYNFVDKDFGRIYKYALTVYSDDSECSNKKLKTIKLVRPMYNAYSEYSFCKNSSNYYCQKFTTTALNLKGNEDFLSKIKVNNDKRSIGTIEVEKKETKSFMDMIMDNWQMYAGVSLASIVVSLILLIVIKKRKTKKGWEE